MERVCISYWSYWKEYDSIPHLSREVFSLIIPENEFDINLYTKIHFFLLLTRRLFVRADVREVFRKVNVHIVLCT